MTPARQDIRFALFSTLDLESPAALRPVIDDLLRAPVGLKPIQYGRDEPNLPIRDARDVVSAATVGVSTSGLRNGGISLKAGSAVSYNIRWSKLADPTFSLVFGSLQRDPAESLQARLAAWCDLVRELVRTCDAVYGEIRDMSAPFANMPFDLRTRLPDIQPVSIYGAPYVRLFGEKLATAPFHRIERLPTGHYWLEAGDSILTPISEDAKSDIRRHLGEDAFMSGGKRLYRTGLAPEFDFHALLP